MSEPDKLPRLDYESPHQSEPADDFWGVGTPPQMVAADPTDRFVFIGGIAAGILTVLGAMYITRELLVITNQLGKHSDLSMFARVIVIDIVLKSLWLVAAHRLPRRSSFYGGLYVSIFMSWVLIGAIVLR